MTPPMSFNLCNALKTSSPKFALPCICCSSPHTHGRADQHLALPSIPTLLNPFSVKEVKEETAAKAHS